MSRLSPRSPRTRSLRPPSPRVAVLALAASSLVTAAFAFQAPPAGRVLPHVDRRVPAAAKGALAPARSGALAGLERTAGRPLRLRFGRDGSSIAWLHAYGLPLTATAKAAADPERTARGFLAVQADLFGLDPGAVAGLRLRYLERAPSGAVHLGFERLVDGVPVFQGYARVDLDRLGRVVAAGLDAVSDGSAAASGGLDVTARPGLSAREGAERALAAAAVSGVTLEASPAESLPARALTFRSPALRRPVTTGLVWVASAGRLQLGWRSLVTPPGYPARYEVIVDAASGELLYRGNTIFYADTRANVFTESPQAGPRRVETLIDGSVNLDPDFPGGWLDLDRTTGNNAVVQDDRAGDNEVTPGQVPVATPGPPQLFDPAYTADPVADRDLGSVNLFYAINRTHQYFYALGFTESAGNFQADNFGRGGSGGDPVLGDAQDAADTLLDADPNNDVDNNANFESPPDGASGRMQMYLWTNAPPWRDGDLDLDVIIHEFTHGVSTRLVGGRGDSSCLPLNQSGAMGEAWGDFFAASYFDDPIMGEYATQDLVNGIRTAPMDADSYTYGDLCQVIAQGCEVHADGEIWAQVLWELRQALVASQGFTGGRRQAELLIVDGMKLAPCLPTFLDARDAILAADQLRYGGAHYCLIWTVLAQNGMGVNAADNTGGDETLPVEEFSLPAVCLATSGQARVDWDFDRYGCDSRAQVRVVDGDLQGLSSVTVRSAAGDVEPLPIGPAPLSGAPVFDSGPFPVRGVASPAAVVAGNGSLEAVRGDLLTVTYVDASSGGSLSDDATLACQADVVLQAYRFSRGTCDVDAVPGYDLPGFLDAGESAVLEVELVNREPFALADAAATLTSLNPAVTVVPAAPLAVGTLPATIGTHLAPVTLRFLVSAAATVASGDVALLHLDLTARGYDGPIAAIEWPVRLHLDYQVVPRRFQEGFDPGSPTLPAWTHAPTRATPTGDQWRIVTCQSVSAPQSYKNGGGDPGCGDYSDNQGDPYLASPSFRFRPAAAEAARLRRLQFDHHVRLAVPTDPVGLCDAEAVGILVSNDPAAIDTTDILSLAGEAVAFFTVIPALGIDDNTTGFQHVDIDLGALQLAGVDLGADAYLTWLFAVDITNALAPPQLPCAFFPAVGEGYYLDGVDLEWEEVVAVPQATTCAASCLALAVADPPRAQGCAAAGIDLTAATSLAIGCAGPLEYRWSGGELGAGRFAPVPSITVFPPASTRYNLEVRCTTDLGCSDAVDDIVMVTGAPLGGPIGNALYMARQATGLHLDWSRRSLEPRLYNVHRALRKEDVDDAVIGSQPVVQVVMDEDVTDLPLPAGSELYEVYGRDGCTGGSVIP